MSQQTGPTAATPDIQSKPEPMLWYGYEHGLPPEKCGLFKYLGGHYIWECGALSKMPMNEWTAHLRGPNGKFKVFP